MELSISMLGFVKKPTKNKFCKGEILIGLASSGLHSNGFFKVREIFGEKYYPDFTRPTEIYLLEVLKLAEKFDIGGLMHITGGAYTKLKDLLSKNIDVVIGGSKQLKPQNIFKQICTKGVSDKEMYRTFNCGIGFIFSVKKDQAKNCLVAIKKHKADIIGEVVSGRGEVIVESKFSNTAVVF